MRQAISRGALVLITLLVATIYYVPIGHVDFAENWGEGTFGITPEPRSTVVVSVDPGSAADRAGIRPGDRIVDDGNYETSLRIKAPYAGEHERVTLERGDARYTVLLTARAVPTFDLLQRVGGVLALIPSTVFLIVAFLLVFVRPSIMSWSFYVFAVGYFGTSPAFMYWSHVLSPEGYVVLSFVLSTFFGAWSVLPLLPFVLRFPNGDVLGWRRPIDPFVWVFLALSFGLYVVEWRAFSSTGSIPSWDIYPTTVIPLVAFFLACLILAKNFAKAAPSDRQRFAFISLGTLISFVATTLPYSAPA